MLHVQPPAAAAPAPAPAEPAPRPRHRFNYPAGYMLPPRQALESYASWLFYERRLVCLELYPDQPRADCIVMAGNAGFDWHSYRGDGRRWSDFALPSSRAVAVLDMAGVDWRGYKADPDWPVHQDSGRRPALPPLYPHADADLLAAASELMTLDMGIDGYLTTYPNANAANDPKLAAIEARRGAVLEVLSTRPARTLDGMQAKAEALKTVGVQEGCAETLAALGTSLAEDVARFPATEHPAAAGIEPSPALRALVEEWERKAAHLNAPSGKSDDECDRLTTELNEVEYRIYAAPIASAADLALLARVVRQYAELCRDFDNPETIEERAYAALFRAMEGLAGARQGADPDPSLKVLYEQWERKCEEIERAPDEDQDRLMDELRDLETALRDYPVETLQALAIKAKVAEAFLHVDADIGALDIAEVTYQSVFADIARLAERRA